MKTHNWKEILTDACSNDEARKNTRYVPCLTALRGHELQAIHGDYVGLRQRLPRCFNRADAEAARATAEFMGFRGIDA